jgi:hypothetical protein
LEILKGEIKMLKKFLLSFVLVWASKDFVTLESAVNFMNTLPTASSEKAYVIALNSARSGMFNGYYSVIYRIEK